MEFDLLTLRDVAALLHCSKAHVSNVMAGKVTGCHSIPVVRLGRRRLVRRESLVRWVEENEGWSVKKAPAIIAPLPERVSRGA
jgi:hypothetical protein